MILHKSDILYRHRRFNCYHKFHPFPKIAMKEKVLVYLDFDGRLIETIWFEIKENIFRNIYEN